MCVFVDGHWLFSLTGTVGGEGRRGAGLSGVVGGGGSVGPGVVAPPLACQSAPA